MAVRNTLYRANDQMAVPFGVRTLRDENKRTSPIMLHMFNLKIQRKLALLYAIESDRSYLSGQGGDDSFF